MSRKNNKGKPTRKDMDNAIQNIYQSLHFIGEKLNYLENFTKATDIALDLYTKFNKNQDDFKKYIEKYQKEQEKKLEKEKEKS